MPKIYRILIRIEDKKLVVTPPDQAVNAGDYVLWMPIDLKLARVDFPSEGGKPKIPFAGTAMEGHYEWDGKSTYVAGAVLCVDYNAPKKTYTYGVAAVNSDSALAGDFTITVS